MTIPPLLSPSFWFNPTPAPFIPFVDRLILVILAAFILVAIFAFVARSRKTVDRLSGQVLGRIGGDLLGFGIVGLLLYAFAYERVMYFSMRALWLPLFAWFAWEMWRFWKFAFVKVPEIRKAQTEKEEFEKWLPKKKK